MAAIFKLVLLCAIGFSSAQQHENEGDPKVQQKWYDMNSMFIRYGYRMYGENQLRKHEVFNGMLIDLTIHDVMKDKAQFWHPSVWWQPKDGDVAEIKYMTSKDQPPNETLFEYAKKEIESNTCIKFTEIEETPEKNCASEGNTEYFCVYGEKGTCAAEYGQNLTKPSLFSVSDNCGERGVLHEMGHMLGLQHATARSDRNDYIDISFKLIGYATNQFFRRAIFHEYQTCDKSNAEKMKMPYDYASIMHQGILHWTENDELLLTTRDPKYLYMIDYAQDFNPHLSHYDKLLINTIYECDKRFGKKCGSKTCDNLGYLAKNCTCVCPKGTSGDTCSSKGSSTDVYDLPDKPACWKEVAHDDVEFSLQDAGLVPIKDMQAPFTQHCVIHVTTSIDCKLPMVSIDTREAMLVMQDRIRWWFDNDVLDCSYFSVFYNVTQHKTRNLCWDMMVHKPMYWIWSRQRQFWMFARFRDKEISAVAGRIRVYYHSSGDYRCDLGGNDIFDAINAGRARSIGGSAESAKAMAIVLPAVSVCLLLVLGFVYWKFIRAPMAVDEEQAEGDTVDAKGDVTEQPPPEEGAEEPAE